MRALIQLVLHPISSVALIVALWRCVAQTNSLMVKVLALFFGVLLYFALTPRARRNASLWAALAGKAESPSLEAVSAMERAVGQGTSCVVLSFPLCEMDALTHALAFGQRPLLSSSTVMYVCRSLPEQALFWMPLARLTLWYLGGLVQYSRGLLIQLLRRAASSPQKRGSVAVVLLPPIPVAHKECGSSGSRRVEIYQKGIFAAALRTGAAVIPALVNANGSVLYGKLSGGGSTVAVPTPDQVKQLAGGFGAALANLFEEVTGASIVVV